MNCFNISIAERFRPFSHQPGAVFPIPYSPYAVEIYPARLSFFSLAGDERFAIDFPIQGEVEKFTAVCDLEMGVVKVSFYCAGSFYRYLLYFDGTLHFIPEKGELKCRLPKGEQLLKRKPVERLSFGSTKKQEIENVRARRGIKEILPLWFMLGQAMPHAPQYPGADSLEGVLKLFQTSTRGLFVPDFQLHQAFGAEKPSGDDLLHAMYLAIRGLVFKEESGKLIIRPLLDAGRMTGLKFSLGTIDLEWSKHRLRRVLIHAEKSGNIILQWPKEVMSFRLRPLLSENALPSLDIQAGSQYFFDNFLCK